MIQRLVPSWPSPCHGVARLPQPSPNLSALHTTFVDRLITRWELVIEHHIRLKQAASTQDVADLSKELRAHCEVVDQELLALRGQVHELGGSLPLDQLVETTLAV